MIAGIGFVVYQVIEHWKFFKGFFIGLWKGIWAPVKGFLNLMIDGINYLISGLNKLSIQVPDWVPGIGGQNWGINIGKIPKFHDGGVFRALTPGGEGLALLRDGEQVLTPEQRLSQTVTHTGTIRIEGVNSSGQFVGVVDLLVSDKDGLTKLEREMKKIRLSESARLGDV